MHQRVPQDRMQMLPPLSGYACFQPKTEDSLCPWSLYYILAMSIQLYVAEESTLHFTSAPGFCDWAA